MSYVVLYRDTGSVLGNHAARRDAIRDAVSIALDRPDLSFIVGLTEVDPNGAVVTPFMSASDLLARNDEDAVAVAVEHSAEVVPNTGARSATWVSEDEPETGVQMNPLLNPLLRGTPADSPAADPRALAREGLLALGFAREEVDALLTGASGDTPEALLADALRAARG